MKMVFKGIQKAVRCLNQIHTVVNNDSTTLKFQSEGFRRTATGTTIFKLSWMVHSFPRFSKQQNFKFVSGLQTSRIFLDPQPLSFIDPVLDNGRLKLKYFPGFPETHMNFVLIQYISFCTFWIWLLCKRGFSWNMITCFYSPWTVNIKKYYP